MVGSKVKEGEGRKRVEAKVGGLVWVQRKNGSWWPGQIVGQEELSESDLVPLRSGTPIKLLGRDDTSLEWHDLETTKVVKAFRCGDYDACIEKARVVAANNSLKQTRYPRRENAIVCALNIEKASMFKDCAKGETLVSYDKDSASIPLSRDNEYSSEEASSEETVSACEETSDSTQELPRCGISYGETNGFTDIKGRQLRARRRKTLYDSEDDGYEGIKRMKGLNDLGMGSDNKNKVQVLALPIPTQQNGTLNNFGCSNGTSVRTIANGSSTATLKRKRSQVVHVQELLKRKHQRRPVTKVLENTTLVPVRIIYDEFANPFERSDAVSPSYECEDGNHMKDAELFDRLFLEDYPSDDLIDVPFVDEELPVPDLQTSFPKKRRIGDPFIGNFSRNIQVKPSSSKHEPLDESDLSYFSASHVTQEVEKSASQWQSKGKRNARHLSKAEEPYSVKIADMHDNSDVFMLGHENPGRLSPSSNGLVNGLSDRRNHISVASSQWSFSYQRSRFPVPSDFEMADVSPRSVYADLLLYEVEVTVEATRHQVQHVPYISLMSKLNGKPITGHPVPVEALEDGFCDISQISDYLASGSCELDDEDTEMDFVIEPDPPLPKMINVKPVYHGRKRGRKPKPKKKHGSSSKKTKKLSALTGPNKQSLFKSKSAVQAYKGPTLACVPLKIVFSRINEALNGSLRSAHHVKNSQ